MNRTVAFHGAEHKAGCTMITQSVAEIIAGSQKGMKVLLAALNGRKSAEYLSDKTTVIDQFKTQLMSGIGIDQELLRPCRKYANLYILSGVDKEEESRHFFPEAVDALLESADSRFDLIIMDSGSEADHGLALGALQKAGRRYLVMEQTESNLRRYEKNRAMYARLKIPFEKCIINQYVDHDPYTLNYIAARLSLNRTMVSKVEKTPCGRQAEMEQRTFLELKQEKYRKDILKIANDLLEHFKMEGIILQRKRTWKSFI